MPQKKIRQLMATLSVFFGIRYSISVVFKLPSLAAYHSPAIFSLSVVFGFHIAQIFMQDFTDV
jgi:hypothetical protein